MTDAAAAPVSEVRRAGGLVLAAGVALLCAWVLVPIYLLFVNALSSPAEVQGFPKSFLPSLDLASLTFFVQFQGVAAALWNSTPTLPTPTPIWVPR